MDTSALVQKLEKAAPKSVLEIRPFGHSNDVSVWVEAKAIAEVAKVLCDDSDLALDWLENLSVFQVDDALVLTYFLRSSRHPDSLILRGSVVPGQANAAVEAPSVAQTWPMARAFEREIQDLFGIRFGHPSGTVLPEGWRGFPLRKEYKFPEQFQGITHRREGGGRS